METPINWSDPWNKPSSELGDPHWWKETPITDQSFEKSEAPNFFSSASQGSFPLFANQEMVTRVGNITKVSKAWRTMEFHGWNHPDLMTIRTIYPIFRPHWWLTNDSRWSMKMFHEHLIHFFRWWTNGFHPKGISSLQIGDLKKGYFTKPADSMDWLGITQVGLQLPWLQLVWPMTCYKPHPWSRASFCCDGLEPKDVARGQR